MQFSQIPGQESVVKKLIQGVTDNRIAHAQLFLGQEGGCGMPMALAYAQYLLCTNRSSSDSCGICKSCSLFVTLAHPDLHFSFPGLYAGKDVPVSPPLLNDFKSALLTNPYQSLKNWTELLVESENKQLIFNVAEAKNIINKLALTSFYSGYRIMIIWKPEIMRDDVANKLLKIIEEPPDKTIFILVCENEDALLKTIYSRTQSIKTNRVSDEQLTVFLTESLGLSRNEAERIVFMCEGNLAEATEFINEGQSEDGNFLHFREWMRICYKAEVEKAIRWVEEFSRWGREKQKNFFVFSLSIIRECLLLNYADPSLSRLTGEEKEFAIKFAPFIHGANCEEIINETESMVYYISRNANVKIAALDLSFKMMKLLRMKAPSSQINA